MHRIMDVEKTKVDSRKLKLESLRYAARILGSSLDDPEVEKKIVIRGGGERVVVPADDT